MCVCVCLIQALDLRMWSLTSKVGPLVTVTSLPVTLPHPVCVCVCVCVCVVFNPSVSVSPAAVPLPPLVEENFVPGESLC